MSPRRLAQREVRGAGLYDGVSERDFQRQVIDAARLLGWTVFWTYRSEHSPKGDLDLRMIRPPRILWMELKAERGKLTKEQEATVELLQACKAEVYVARPHEMSLVLEVLAR